MTVEGPPATTVASAPTTAASVAASAAVEPREDLSPGTASAIIPAAAVAAPSPTVDAAPPPNPTNEVPPLPVGEELQERARALFEAIAADDPTRAEALWFPKEPFIPLKDVKGAERYWETLHSTYAMDIHALHRKRKSWEGATFTRFELGTKPKWVKPGEEANKIGYYRSFRGAIQYEVDGKRAEIEVRTMITWQGRWYITHLSKFKN